MSLTCSVARGAGLLETDRVADAPLTYCRSYRVHATITLLGVPLFSKDNVGGASAMVEHSASGAPHISAIQFSGGSWPDRLRGFDRFGMAQEALLQEDGSIVESAYLSFMTSSAEKNLDQAKHSFTERTARQQISVAHGRARQSGYLVQPGVNGYVAATMQEIVRAVLLLRLSKFLLKHMAVEARSTALAYSWDNVFDRIYQRYGELVATRAQPARIMDDVVALP